MCSDSYIFFRKNRGPFIKLNGKPEEKILKVQGANRIQVTNFVLFLKILYMNYY